MRVLLTGGAGYIGSHTAVALLNAGHQPVILDNFSNSLPESIRRVEQLTGKAIPIYVGDCCDEAFVERVLSAEKVDAVIHFAGYKAVAESVRNPLTYYRNNIDSILALCAALTKHNIKCLVFSSSATVYGDLQTPPMREDGPTGACTCPYAQTKFMIEQMLRDLYASDTDWSIVLLRYFNPVGAHESGLIGEDPTGIPNNLMPFVCQTATGVQDKLSMYGNDYPTPDGSCIRDYIHVMDLAEGHVKALEYACRTTGETAINLGTGVGYSVFEVVSTFERVNHLTLNKELAPRRPGDLPISYADPQKAERLLGWKATRTLDDMCRDAWNWQHRNPNGYR